MSRTLVIAVGVVALCSGCKNLATDFATAKLVVEYKPVGFKDAVVRLELASIQPKAKETK